MLNFWKSGIRVSLHVNQKHGKYIFIIKNKRNIHAQHCTWNQLKSQGSELLVTVHKTIIRDTTTPKIWKEKNIGSQTTYLSEKRATKKYAVGLNTIFRKYFLSFK